MTTLKDLCASRYAALPEPEAKRATKRAYDLAAAVADVLGRTAEGFPDAAVPWLNWLLDRAEAGQVKPATARAALVAAMNATDAAGQGEGELLPAALPATSPFGISGNGKQGDETALVGVSPNAERGDGVTVLLRLAEATERLIGVLGNAEQKAQPPADRALTRAQAAELLACSPRAVGRFVPALRPGVFRESDCRRYLATGEPQRAQRGGK